MIVCKNCDYTFEGKFCPNCSQKANTHRFSLMHFGHEFFHAVTHTDKGILFLMKELFRRPGKVALEYNAGKRKKYFSPFTFLLIMMAMQIYLAKKTDIYGHFINDTQKFVQEMAKNTPSVGESDAEKDLETAKQRNPKILENSKLITFLFLPVLALFTWLFFKKSGFNYAENLVFNIIVQAQLYVFFLLICILPFILYPRSVILLIYIYFIFSWIFSFIAYRQFYNQGWGKVIWKGIAIQVLYLICVQQITNAIIGYL